MSNKTVSSRKSFTENNNPNAKHKENSNTSKGSTQPHHSHSLAVINCQNGFSVFQVPQHLLTDTWIGRSQTCPLPMILAEVNWAQVKSNQACSFISALIQCTKVSSQFLQDLFSYIFVGKFPMLRSVKHCLMFLSARRLWCDF